LYVKYAIVNGERNNTNRIILTNYEIFRALDDPIRGKIVQLLHKKQLNVEQITRRLKKFGYKKAVTTIRHHIEILKNSGLIEISKIEEARGGITKYYGTSTKLWILHYQQILIKTIQS